MWVGDDKTLYQVVINHEDQYSIWPADRWPALGWRLAGFCGNRSECLAYIEKMWLDVRPVGPRRYEPRR